MNKNCITNSGVPKLKRGFTLIELLVVIAIIGILASVVLASLSQARGKSADAAVKANLAGLRAQAQLQYDAVGCFANTGATCIATSPAANSGADLCGTPITGTIFLTSKFIDVLTAVQNASGNALVTCRSAAAGASWAVASVLKTDNTLAWCVDSQGLSKQINNGGAAYDQAALNADVWNAGVARCGT